jgi:hypothetical protein
MKARCKLCECEASGENFLGLALSQLLHMSHAHASEMERILDCGNVALVACATQMQSDNPQFQADLADRQNRAFDL